jgi:hypothetical protein
MDALGGCSAGDGAAAARAGPPIMEQAVNSAQFPTIPSDTKN